MNNVKKLPDCYEKTDNSNNDKLLKLNELICSDVKQDCIDVFNSLDLDNATGKTLEKLAETVNLKRGNYNDEQLRFAIKIQISKMHSKGDYNSSVELLCLSLGIDKIKIEDGVNSCEVEIAQIPYDVFEELGISSDKIVKMLKELMPIGVGVESANFDGTFEFEGDTIDCGTSIRIIDEVLNCGTSTRDITDKLTVDAPSIAETGFSDDNSSVGGYFGDAWVS